MIHRLIYFLALLLLVGCQKDMLEPIIDDNRPNADGSVGFRLTADDAQDEAQGYQSRGTPQNSLDKYSLVKVNVYSHTSDFDATVDNDVELYRHLELEQEESKWEYKPHMFWPANSKLSFIAYASDVAVADAGLTFQPASGAPETMTYTVPKDVTKQPDLLVSTLIDQTKVNNVFMTMKHALSCVSFCGDVPEKSVYVKKITLRNVYGRATMALNSSTVNWKLDESSKGVTVFEAGIDPNKPLQEAPTQPNYLMTETGYLMMPPQPLKGAAIDVLYWNGTDDKANKIVTYTLPVDDPAYSVWKAGQKYVYRFGTKSEDITVVYYERYADNTYGLYYYDRGELKSTIVSDKVIEEAGYGALAKRSIGNVAGIRLTSPSSSAVTSGTMVKIADDAFLYPVNQSAKNTFALAATTTPQNVYFNGSAKSCGMIVPHFAKGVYSKVQTAMTTHVIRTPQQMRNITRSDVSSVPRSHTYTQEMNLDFSKVSIGGGQLTTSVVNRQFHDVFDGRSMRIENVTIQAFSNGALFQGNGGDIIDVVLINPSITSGDNTGGIAAVNQLGGVITRPRLCGEDISTPFLIKGTSGYVGAIAGYNYGTIAGNSAIDIVTELPVAEVSGWGSVRGESTGTGGIAGENDGVIATCLVNGVYVTGTKQGEAVMAKITIEGGNYVGGLVGVNKANIDGNQSNDGVEVKAEPDVAGLVDIIGGDFVGGIVGENDGILNQVNIRLGRGDANNATIIKGNKSVGGIVGYNRGTLQTNAKSFISVRGNIHISGTENVGGIVGNNQHGDITNCFVFNFFSQSTTNQLIHYAPKISGDVNVGGIAGYAALGVIKQCSVFSTVSAANANGGDVTNAVASIKATTKSVGGIVGNAFAGLTITTSSVLGNVKVEGESNSGGIVGENSEGTSISLTHIGNSGTAVSEIYNKLFRVINLPVFDTRMQTNGGVMTYRSGTPTMEGTFYVGGICGVNWGTIEAVLIKDNIKIGTPSSIYVGGISGGNGKRGVIKNCDTYNPAVNLDASVAITGKEQVGGIVGMNNGVVESCRLGLAGVGQSRLIAITGGQKLGGIAGSNGGPVTGDANTRISDCNVYGKVLVESTLGGAAWDKVIVGGILGENGPTNNVVNCNVIGYASSGDSPTGYDITLRGYGQIGGIAGANYGNIHGASSSSYSKVTHTAVIATGGDGYSGGLVGFQQSTPTYPGKLYYCDVSRGVLIHYMVRTSGAFVGNVDGQGGTKAAPILFGTTLGGITNKIYTGTAADRVRINAFNGPVILPPAIDGILEYYPDAGMDPDATTGNLWTRFAQYNYLHYSTYQ